MKTIKKMKNKNSDNDQKVKGVGGKEREQENTFRATQGKLSQTEL